MNEFLDWFTTHWNRMSSDSQALFVLFVIGTATVLAVYLVYKIV